MGFQNYFSMEKPSLDANQEARAWDTLDARCVGRSLGILG